MEREVLVGVFRLRGLLHKICPLVNYCDSTLIEKRRNQFFYAMASEWMMLSRAKIIVNRRINHSVRWEEGKRLIIQQREREGGGRQQDEEKRE